MTTNIDIDRQYLINEINETREDEINRENLINEIYITRHILESYMDELSKDVSSTVSIIENEGMSINELKEILYTLKEVTHRQLRGLGLNINLM